MRARVFYTEKAVKELKKLHRPIAKKVVERIAFYVTQKDPLRHAKRLRPPFDDLYRFRIGNHRAIFEVDAKGNLLCLTILKVGHRKDVYE